MKHLSDDARSVGCVIVHTHVFRIVRDKSNDMAAAVGTATAPLLGGATLSHATRHPKTQDPEPKPAKTDQKLSAYVTVPSRLSLGGKTEYDEAFLPFVRSDVYGDLGCGALSTFQQLRYVLSNRGTAHPVLHTLYCTSMTQACGAHGTCTPRQTRILLPRCLFLLPLLQSLPAASTHPSTPVHTTSRQACCSRSHVYTGIFAGDMDTQPGGA